MAIQQLREPQVAFRELYLLEHSRRIRQAVKLPLAYLGGVTSLAGARQVLGEGFDALALGRALIAEPDLVGKFQSGASQAGICNACNRCVAMMYTPGGTSCVLGAPGDAVLNGQAAAS
jgi:2,4-dienoyl-CoA reductase-like NADH-dependent reductase (Old Yellow Enzyme family)